MKKSYCIIMLIFAIGTTAWGDAGLIEDDANSTIPAPVGPHTITDHFSVNSAGNYTAVTGTSGTGLLIDSGCAESTPNQLAGQYLHNTSMASIDHWAEVDFSASCGSLIDYSGPKVRSDGTRGYMIRLNGSQVQLCYFVGSVVTNITSWGDGGVHGTVYALQVSGTGSSINLVAYVDGVERINYTNPPVHYDTGSSVGLILYKASDLQGRKTTHFYANEGSRY